MGTANTRRGGTWRARLKLLREVTRHSLRRVRRLPKVFGLLLLSAGTASAQPTTGPPGQEPTQAGPEEGVFVTPGTAATREGAVIIDTRGSGWFALGHPRGAASSSWDDFSDPAERGRLHPEDRELASRIGALGVTQETPVYVIGDWETGWGEEGRIFWMLEVLGHTDVHIVTGGFDAWLASGLPTELGVALPAATVFDVRRQSEGTSTLSDFGANGFEGVVVLDVRTAEEYAGATPFGAQRGGHIPGARHLEWTALFDENGVLEDEATLRGLLPSPDLPIVAYCTGGVRSGFVYAVMRDLGYDAVSNYAGSWWEYARSPLPVE